LLAEYHPAEVKEHNRKQIRRPAKKIEQEIGEKRANPAYCIVYFSGSTCLRESGIARVVAKEREPQDECQGAKNP